jgi:sugar-specific transcriptional regulator TrmB
MQEQISQFKRIFNLKTYEARLYLAALNFSKANLTELAKKAGFPRTAAYSPLQCLLKQGFVSAVKIKKRTYYKAVEMNKLKLILERKRVDLENMIQSLDKKITVPERELSISYYQGVSGVEMAADIFLEEGQTKKAKSWESTKVNIREHGFHQLQEYINRRIKKGVRGEMIVSADAYHPVLKELLKKDKKELRKTIIVSPKKYPFCSAIAVFDDSVLIFTFGDTPFAVLIKNKDIATTFWSMHEMYWDRYMD